jgi:hypothetical protein
MGQRPPTKRDIVDAIIAEAAKGQFKGDNRDGAPPPITLQNFLSEIFRYGAKAYRAQLSRLSFADLLTKLIAANADVEAQQEQILKSGELVERLDREAAERANRQQQSTRAKKPRLQAGILAAAHHYRQIAKKNAKEAWRAIKHKPYETADGRVAIETSKGGKEKMLVQSRRGQQKRTGIVFGTFEDRYWPKANSHLAR